MQRTRHQQYTAQSYVQRQRVPRHGPAQQSQQHSHLIIFDWDDTLFPTSQLMDQPGVFDRTKESPRSSMRGGCPVEAKPKALSAHDLHRFAKSTYFMLRRYIEIFGAQSIFIVTNAMKGWVTHSLNAMSAIFKQTDHGAAILIGLDYFALIKDLLTAHKIPVISAQHLHAERYPQQPTMWKTFTFKRLAKRHFKMDSRSSSKCSVYVLLSIGDSDSEYAAAFETKRMLETDNRLNRNEDKIQLLRVKLRKRPTIDHMVLQNEHLLQVASKYKPRSVKTVIGFVGLEEVQKVFSDVEVSLDRSIEVLAWPSIHCQDPPCIRWPSCTDSSI